MDKSNLDLWALNPCTNKLIHVVLGVKSVETVIFNVQIKLSMRDEVVTYNRGWETNLEGSEIETILQWSTC